MPTSALTTILALLAAGCHLGVEAREVTCAGEVCPVGTSCVEDRCVADGSQAPDAGAPDAGEPEKISVPDAAPAMLVPCDDQFGAASGYQLCAEEPASCEFFAQTAGQTCADFCALYSSECINSWDASTATPCTREIEDGCLVPHNTQICLCSRASQGLGGAAASR
jgi:hypothetical protein